MVSSKSQQKGYECSCFSPPSADLTSDLIWLQQEKKIMERKKNQCLCLCGVGMRPRRKRSFFLCSTLKGRRSFLSLYDCILKSEPAETTADK